jgi:hypothetical protein
MFLKNIKNHLLRKGKAGDVNNNVHISKIVGYYQGIKWYNLANIS